MQVAEVVEPVSRLFRPRARRVSGSPTRAHIEYRAVSDDELPRLIEQIKVAASYLTRAEWVEVNPHTRRVVFSYEEYAYEIADLVDVVEAAEQAAGVDNAPFAASDRDHPADLEEGLARLVELAIDLGSLTVGLGLSLSPFPALPLSRNLVTALSVLRDSPRLRRGIEERLGTERARLIINLMTSAAQAIAQRPMSTMVDVLHRSALLAELQARRSVWYARETTLCAEPTGVFPGATRREDRPVPLPRGPIEEYADRAWFISLSGFAISFITTRSFQRATAALFGGLPRPARIGRDVFAAFLGRGLAQRGILLFDRDVLRRLDRIDCLVIQGDLIAREKFVISAVVCEDPEVGEGARQRAQSLFQVEGPLRVQVDGLWRLGPWSLSGASADPSLREHARQRMTDGALILALERAGRVVAAVEIEIVAQTGVEELISAAHEAQMRVVIASADEQALQTLNADDVIPDSEGIGSGIRRLQRDGRVVCLVATGNSPGLPLADCAIGLTRTGEPVPWGAQIICREDLADVRFVIAASIAARKVSKQCVNVALGAASMGALASAGGLLPLTTRRVLFVINTANMVSMANGLRHAVAVSRAALPEPRDPTPWHALDARGVLKRLASSPRGLSRLEVVRRGERPAREPSALVELADAISDELFNPLAPLLAAGAGLSAIVGSIADASMVAGVVGLNALVGGAQRFKTERKIRHLAEAERRFATVRRDGSRETIDAVLLVRGDIVELQAGDVVPADCRIVEASSLEIDASSLTGESLPVKKSSQPSFEAHIADRSSMLYAGTALAAGRASAVVVAVGDATEARRGAAGAKSARAQGGVEKRLRSLMDLTGPIALAAGVGVVGGGLLRGRKLEDLVGSGVSLAVASVPEGLPVLATAAQLSAAERLSHQNALVRNPRSLEALGRIDVICVDKTGTVTHGSVELHEVSDGIVDQGLDAPDGWAQLVIAAALRASTDPERLVGLADPTEEGLRRAGERLGIDDGHEFPGWHRHSEVPFEAMRSFHATLGEGQAGCLLSVKGSPEALLPRCTSWRHKGTELPLDESTCQDLLKHVAKLASRGLRVLAVAEARVPDLSPLTVEGVQNLAFLGFLAFADPVRPSAVTAVVGLRRAGIRAVMITGDHPNTAVAIASELALPFFDRVMTGAELARLTDPQLDQRIERVGVFARVTPSQKVRVVRALQRAGRVVAMVGDGANDAPAIRLSDVGIALGEHSTSAARGAADLVLLDGRVETLVHAIAEGRAMWASVRDAVSILLGGNLGEIGFTLGAGLIDGRPPLNARQLLLVNLLTDVGPAMAIALRPPSADSLEALATAHPDTVMGKPLNRQMASRALATAAGAGSAWVVARLTGSAGRARTIGLAALVGSQLGQTLRSGGLNRPVILTSVGSAALLVVLIQTPFLSRLFGCRPLGPVGWATAIGASVAATALSQRISVLLGAEQPSEASPLILAPDVWNRLLGRPEPDPAAQEG